jgi:septation ring formation regulator EzrA
LANDLKKINSSPNIFIFADKTRNIYEASRDTYNKLIHDNITKTHKHGSEDTIDEIDSELKYISNNLGIGDKIEKMKKLEAFISLKDHKENFENNPKCRLINPATNANQEN